MTFAWIARHKTLCDLPIAENLLARNFKPGALHKVWTSDITCITYIAYIAAHEGWLYRTAVIDLFSRQVVGRQVLGRQARDEAIGWLTFYNHRRLHLTLG